MTRLSRFLAAAVFLGVVFVAMIPLGHTLGGDGALIFAAINAVAVAAVVWLARSGYRAWGHGFLFSGLLMLARPLMCGTTGPTLGGGPPDTGDLLEAIPWTPQLVAGMGIGLLFLAAGIYLCLSDRREVLVVNGRLVIRRVQEFR